jgi:hypothetical protein
MMKVEDVREILHLAQVDPTYYSLDGETHEALCLLSRGQEWQVFVSERGERVEERTFETEDAACTYFLKRLFQLSRTR